MKHIFPFIIALLTFLGISAQVPCQCPHGNFCEICIAQAAALDSLVVKDPVAAFNAMPQPEVNYNLVNWSMLPKVFSGYQDIKGIPSWRNMPLKYNLQVMTPIEVVTDSIGGEEGLLIETLPDGSTVLGELVSAEQETQPNEPNILHYKTPKWLMDAIRTTESQENLLYSYMIDHPEKIEYAYWDLPLPPVLLEEDRSFIAFLKRQKKPEVKVEDAVLPELEVKKKHWLHKFGAMLQLSQAYVSPNWYQGGNDYLSFLFGFNWNVDLNQVYHPKLLFQSALSYKLAISTNPKGSYHKYNIAEDNFQYNLNAGLKAVKDWYYSLNLQFKTQLLNNFADDSSQRTTSFLSPGDLNLGLGMSYTHKNKLNTLQYTLTISPLSYNLKTCITDPDGYVHSTYNIPAGKKTISEIGSNLDFNMEWKILPNISYKTRVFMFTDYKYYLADWQNTFNFEITKFLSTQLFVHLRYDGSVEPYGKWKKFMMREILSFGLSYTFSTKP